MGLGRARVFRKAGRQAKEGQRPGGQARVMPGRRAGRRRRAHDEAGAEEGRVPHKLVGQGVVLAKGLRGWGGVEFRVGRGGRSGGSEAGGGGGAASNAPQAAAAVGPRKVAPPLATDMPAHPTHHPPQAQIHKTTHQPPHSHPHPPKIHETKQPAQPRPPTPLFTGLRQMQRRCGGASPSPSGRASNHDLRTKSVASRARMMS